MTECTRIYKITKIVCARGGGGGGKRRGLGPRNDVLTTCKAVQNPYWPAVFLNWQAAFRFRAKKKKVGILRARVFN